MRSGAALLALLALALPASARADDAAVLYQSADVARIDLTLSDDAQQALHDDPSTYVDATLRLAVADRVFGPGPVEVRLKGRSSFRPLGRKAALKVKFPRGNRPFGVKKLTLNNLVQDASMVHEALGYEVLRAAGVAAPRTGFAYVRVNERDYGLYLNLETYDDVSLARLFATTQHLYEAGDAGVDVTPGGAGTYEVDEGDEDDRADLEALIAAANAPGSGWAAGMAGTADLDAMARMWAGEQYVGHWDGYSTSGGTLWPNNYYLHSDDGGRFTMLPSGMDQTFQRRDPFPGAGDGRLIERCLSDAPCLNAFRSSLGGVSAAADTMGVGTRLDALAATVARWRRCPDLERASDAAWQTAVTGTRRFLRDQRVAVAAYLGAAAPAFDPALESNDPPPLSAARCPTAPDPPPATPHPQLPAGEPQPAAPPASGVAGFTQRSPRRPRVRPSRLTARVSPRLAARPPFRLTTSGSLLPPRGLGRAKACAGRVTVRIKAGARTVAVGETFLRRNCTFSSSASFADASPFAGRGRLTVEARFKGNAALLPRSAAAQTVVVATRR